MTTMRFFLILVSCIWLTGCATYQAMPLTALDPQYMCTEKEGISIGCKAFSKKECLRYLDRDVLKKGYQPIQLSFHNRTDKSYAFSIYDVTLPCTTAEDVTKKVHTSTAGRITGYTLGSLFFYPLIIPAIVDGIRSSNANAALDKDFLNKSKDHFEIPPHSFHKTLIFIPRQHAQTQFDLTLREPLTGERMLFTVSTTPPF